jgi:orotate phosphoribosyltransferase
MENKSQSLSLEEKRDKLFELIKVQGIVFQEVKLSNGSTSKYYYDIKRVINHPQGALLIGELMFNKISQINLNTQKEATELQKIKSVGGLESGATPITTAIVLASARDQINPENWLYGFFVRKNLKTHGLEKKIEGIVKTPLVVVDDVITTGQSAMEAVNALILQNISPAGIISVIDREEDDDKRNVLKKKKIQYESLFKHSEFKEYIESKLD